MIDDKGEHETLREAFRSLATDALPTDECPEPEKLWDGLAGKLPPDELRDVVDHTASCAACAESWRIGLEIEGEGIGESEVREERAASARPWWSWAAVAAILVGVVGISQIGERTERGELRNPSVSGSGIVSLVGEETPLSTDACVLAWSLEAPGEVARYEINVMTEDLRPVSDARNLESPSYRVPESDLASLAPGTRLLWQVEAVLAEGGRVKSETFSVELR